MIGPITAAQTRPLRQAVLRPQQSIDELVYPGDDAPETLHLGAFANDRLVGIASIYRESMPGPAGLMPAGPGACDFAPTPDWRLRGMATTPEARGTGLGGALLEACIEHIAQNGGTRLWCNARIPAAGFYVRYSFTVHGEAFDLPGIGPHYLMSRVIDPSPAA